MTKALHKALRNNREELKESLVLGVYEGQEEKVRGVCQAVNNIISMTYEELMEGYADVKY